MATVFACSWGVYSSTTPTSYQHLHKKYNPHNSPVVPFTMLPMLCTWKQLCLKRDLNVTKKVNVSQFSRLDRSHSPRHVQHTLRCSAGFHWIIIGFSKQQLVSVHCDGESVACRPLSCIVGCCLGLWWVWCGWVDSCVCVCSRSKVCLLCQVAGGFREECND